MNPIVILGMDNTGKTTLVSGLEEHYKGYIQEGKDKGMLGEEVKGAVKLIKSPGPISRQEMHRWCYDEIRRFGTPQDDLVIYDRFGCIDEQIYAPIVRGVKELDHVEHLTNLIPHLHIEDQPVFIYARPSKEEILGFEDGREQMEGVMENGEALLRAYDDLYFRLATSGFNIMLYNYETDDIKEDILNNYLRHAAGIKLTTGSLIDNPDTIEKLNLIDWPADEDYTQYSIENLRDAQVQLIKDDQAVSTLIRTLELNNAKLERFAEKKLLLTCDKLAKEARKIQDAMMAKL